MRGGTRGVSGNLDDDDDTVRCDKKDMLRFTGKTTQADALQAVQRAADRRMAIDFRALVRSQEAREDAEMKAFWESAAEEPSSARQRATRIIKECKTIRKVPWKPKAVTYTRSTNETGKNPIAKRERR